MANHAHRRVGRPKPRPMTGFWTSLTDAEKAEMARYIAKAVEAERTTCKAKPPLECLKPGFRGNCCLNWGKR